MWQLACRHGGFQLGIAASATAAALAFSPANSSSTTCQDAPPRYQTVRFPKSEAPFVRKLFDGVTLAGWKGKTGHYWNARAGEIIGFSHGGEPSGHPIASTYLLTTTQHRHFRLIFEAKIDGEQSIHSGLGVWGRPFSYKDEQFSYRGHLIMVQKAGIESDEWGVFDLYRRGWALGGVSGAWAPDGRCAADGPASQAAKAHVDGWHLMEVVALDNRLKIAVNGYQVLDYVEKDPHLISGGPIGLQLHWIQRPWNSTTEDQRVRFRGLWLVDDPEPYLLTVGDNQFQ